MSEQDQSEKTEKPTPFKLREAKKKGQVSKSIELNHWLLLAAFTSLIYMQYTSLIASLNSEFVNFFYGNFYKEGNFQLIDKWLSKSMLNIVFYFAPVVFFLVVIAVASSVLQTGFIVASNQIKPDIKRLHPKEGIKKVFGRKIFFELIKVILKLLVYGSVLYLGLDLLIDNIYGFASHRSDEITKKVVESVVVALSILLIGLLPIVLLDIFNSKKEYLRKMKMSRRDIKDEHKRNDGNPELKSRRKEIQSELRRKMQSFNKVKDADVIVTNPTRIAIALHYDANFTGIPKIVAKGKEFNAEKIRSLARKYKIPIVRLPALARALYANCDIDDVIPVETYSEVANLYKKLELVK